MLRNKEKYLYPEENKNAVSSPIKRKIKGGVDIERALTNFVRNAQKSGVALTDADIREKASLFSATMGKADDSLSKVSSTSWLEKFKQKNGIGQGSRLLRRASETNISEHMRGSPSLSASQPNSAISPSSPSVLPSPSPLSANRSEDGNKENHLSGYLDFNTEPGSYKHSNSQSTTSLSSAFTDTGTGFSSPNGPFSFSPDLNSGAFQHLPGSNFQRPRSQTFPTLDLEYMNQQPGHHGNSSGEPLTPKYHHITAPSSALESPANEIPQPTYTTTISSPQLRHSSSNTSLGGRSATTGPGSPTQEDARRAADTLLSFIQNAAAAGGGGFVDQNEYIAVVRLTEKLRLHQTAQQQQQQMAAKTGGLERIAEGDSEMRDGEGEVIGHGEGQEGHGLHTREAMVKMEAGQT